MRAEIASLRGLAASFESRLNDLSPIHMLPNDVLAHCFDILTKLDPLDRFRDYMDRQMGLILAMYRPGGCVAAKRAATAEVAFVTYD